MKIRTIFAIGIASLMLMSSNVKAQDTRISEEQWQESQNFNATEISRSNATVLLSEQEESTVVETWDISATEGDNVIATLYSDGTLIISGTGKMKDARYVGNAPWYNQRENILTITIQNEVTNIGSYIFYGCKNLNNIVMSTAITEIGDSAFDECRSLVSVKIPAETISIGYGAFSSCTSLSNIEISEGLKKIEDYAFFYCTNLESIEIPEGVTSIGKSAFSRCENLNSVHIPKSVTSIGASAFQGCAKLLEINVDLENENYTSDEGVFFDKEKTKIITYPAAKINEEYQIPESVVSIEDSAFMDCVNLTHIEIPSRVNNIGSHAFYYCTNLESINIPEGITQIKPYTFYKCYHLKNVEIPDTVTSIGGSAFGYCSTLSSIEISKNVTNIGEQAFSICDNLLNIQVDPENENYSSLEGVLFNKEKTKIIQYPRGKKNQTYEIPRGVTSIENYAFYLGVNLIIVMPEGVTNIGKDAFRSGYRNSD